VVAFGGSAANRTHAARRNQRSPPDATTGRGFLIQWLTEARIASAAAFSCSSVKQEGIGNRTERANKASLFGQVPFS
jgi:hypothetical protein